MGQTPATDNKKTCDTGEGSPPSAKSALSHSIFDWKKGEISLNFDQSIPLWWKFRCVFCPFPRNFPRISLFLERGARPSV
jgi:hypothetical protein